jgi:hypothetical protein
MVQSGDTVELASRIGDLVGGNLTKHQLGLCISLLEMGVPAEAIGHIIAEFPAALERRRSLRK